MEHDTSNPDDPVGDGQGGQGGGASSRFGRRAIVLGTAAGAGAAIGAIAIASPPVRPEQLTEATWSSVNLITPHRHRL
jgi:hypothetical protein